MIFLLFPVMSLWWWILTLGFLGWITILEEKEHPDQAFGILVFYVALAVFFGDFLSVLQWMGRNGFYVLGGFLLGYVPIGFVWGIFRYWWEQSRQLDKYYELKANFLKKHNCSQTTIKNPIPENLIQTWEEELKNCVYSRTYKMPFRLYFQQQKKRIISWMAWWPVSVLCFSLNDVVVRFYQILLLKTQGLFEGIEKRVWKDVEKDFVSSSKE